LATTHRQILLYRALGLKVPQFIHVPLVVGRDGRRLAKRHGDTRIASLREAGVPAEKIVGLLAYWCGWAERGEVLSVVDLLSRFDMAKLSHKPVVWDGNI
jgi:glutamyl-tRNA synthetase